MAVDTAPVEPTYTFPHRDTSGVLLGLDWLQLACVAVALAALTAGFVLDQLTGALIVLPFVAIGLAGAFVPVGGRHAVDWTGPVASTGWQQLSGQDHYRGGPSVGAGELALPGRGGALRVITTGSGAAVIEDPHARTATAVLEVTASPFVLLDRATQSRRVGAFGGLLASACHAGRFARVQWLERTVPDSGNALARWWDEAGDHRSIAARLYEKLIHDAGPAAERHETFLALSLDVRRAARQIRQAGGGRTGLATVMDREMTAFAAAVRAAEIQVVGWTDPRRLGTLVRSSFDPAYIDSAQVSRPTERDAAQLPGPMGHQVFWDRYRTDSGVHATYWISEWPRLPVHAGFLQPLLLECHVRRSVSLVAEPLTADKAARAIRRAKVEHLTNADQRQRIGQVTDRRQEQEYADLLAREAELVAGHGSLRFTGYVTVTVDDDDALPAACAAVEQAALQSHLELRRLYGNQDQAFLAGALPLARGLR